MPYETQLFRFQAGQASPHPPPEAMVQRLSAGQPTAGGELLAILVDLNPPLPRRSRELRALAAETYGASSGSLVARLRRALAEANRFLVQANASSLLAPPTSGSLTCAVFAPGELFLGQVGPAHAWLRHPEGTVELFPQEARPLIPLGATSPPFIHIGYSAIAEGSTLLLTTTTIAEMQALDRWAALLQATAPDELTLRLSALVQETQSSGAALLIHCLPEVASQPAAEPSPRGIWGFLQRAKPASPLPQPASPATVTPAVSPTPTADAVAPPPDGRRASIQAVTSPAPPPPATPPPNALPEFLAARAAEPEPAAPETAPPPAATPPRFRLRLPAPHLKRPGWRLPTLRRRHSPAGVWTGTAPRARLRQALRSLLPGPAAHRRTTKVRPVPPERPPVMAGLALGIALLVFFIAATTYLQFGGTSRAATLLEEATALKAAAYASQTAEDWQRLLALTEQILTLDPQNPQARQLHEEAQTALDALKNAALLAPQLLLELGPTPAPRRLLATADWLFVLNPTVDELLELPLSSEGLSVGAPLSVLKRGQTLLGETVPHLVDLAWMEPGPGYPDGAVLVYSDGGTLYIYEPSLGPGSLTRQRLQGTLEPGTVTLIDTYGNRLYLVERQTNQLWYYVPLNGLYDSPGRPYFAAGMAPPLQNALDLALDGRAYLLTGDGAVHVYFEGTEDRSFQVRGLPEAGFHPTVMAVDWDPSTGHLYLGDLRLGRIVVLDKRGHFLHQFRLPGEALHSLESLAVNEGGTILYLVAENRLYAAPLPDFSTR